MEFRKCLKFLAAGLLAVLVFGPPAAYADVYLKQKNHTDGFSVMGKDQPAQDQVFVTWMSKNRARMDQGEDTTIIIRMDRKMMYMINHAEMKYWEMPFSETGDLLTGALAASDLSGEEQAQAQKMMRGMTRMMSPKVTVKETEETKKIKGWNCRKYEMTMSMMGMTTRSEVWATEDIRLDYDLYSTLMLSMMPKTPGLEKMREEVKKVKGLTVVSTSTMSMMGSDVRSTQELVEVAEKSAPGGTYEVPDGYKKQGK